MSELLSYILHNEDSFRKARLPSLYSDFSTQRHTNPDGYTSNVAAWQQALANAVLAGHGPSSSPSAPGTQKASVYSKEPVVSHKTSFLVMRTGRAMISDLETREWGTPVALQSVFDEAVRSGTMLPLDLFLNSQTSPFSNSWFRLPGAPSLSQVLTWGMKQARGLVWGSEGSDGAGKLQTGDLVLVANLKEAANRVVKASARHNSGLDRIYSKELFMKEFGHILSAKTEISPLDLQVLLTFLSRDQNIILFDGKTIKFRGTEDKSSSITHEDGTIASLKTVIDNLTTQITSLDKKIQKLNTAAQNALRNKNKVLALSSLRSKKLAERNLKQRADTLSQVEEVYMKIEQAADQVDIVRVMQASTGVLRQLHGEIGGVERVEDVVEQLRQEMDNVDEVGNVLNEAGPVIDEGEVDDELEELESQEREARDERHAELTRQRLAALEKGQDTPEQPVSNTEKASVTDLEESIDRLSQMSIDDGKGHGKGRTYHNNKEARSTAAE